MDADAEVDRLLSENGAILKRNSRHQLWKLKNGKTFVRACTPSDWRAGLNQLADLKRELGLTKAVAVEGKRREKKVKQACWKPPMITPTADGALQEKLLSLGIADAARMEQIRKQHQKILTLQTECRRTADANRRKRTQLKRMEHRRCWWCRLKRLFRVANG